MQQQNTIVKLQNILQQKQQAFQNVLPEGIKAEKLIQTAVYVAGRDPKVLTCTIPSILRAVFNAAMLGLIPGSSIGGAYIVPYYNGKIKQYEAVMIPDYRGLLKIARRAGVQGIEAHVVWKDDEFSYEYGTNAYIRHVPRDNKDLDYDTDDKLKAAWGGWYESGL